MFEDIELVCMCGKPFVWTIGEQEFMDTLRGEGKFDRTDDDGNVIPGEVSTPKRCKDCRTKKRQERGGR